MDLNPRRALRPVLATAGVAAAIVASGCGIAIEKQSAEQLDLIGDVALTTHQCVDGMVFPDEIFFPVRAAGDANCGLEEAPPELTATQEAQLKRAAARGSGFNLTQLLIAYEVPNGAKAPASFAFTETLDEPSPEELQLRGDVVQPQPQTGEYRLSSSYASELEELYPTGDDTKWAAYASTPVKAYWFRSPSWSSTARFGIAGAEPGQPFRGPFAYGTIVGGRDLGEEADADTPIDCDAAACDDDYIGIEERVEPLPGRRSARKLDADAVKVATRDLAVVPAGAAVNIEAGKSGDVPFELRYAGKALGAAFSLKGASSLAGATITSVPATFSPGDDQSSTVNLRVAVPAGTPAGTQFVDLVASLPKGQKRSARAHFNVLPPVAQQIIAAPSRTCVSRRSFTIRLRSTKRDPLVSAVVTVNGKRVKTVKKGRITAPVQLTGLPKGIFSVKITAKTRSGKKRTGTRRYRTCTPKRKGGTPKL